MATKHTPGPWKTGDFAQYRDDEDHRAIYQGGRLLALVAHMPGTYVEEQVATARLIAAAPELLEALRKTLRVANRRITANNHDAEWEETIEQAEAVIAKAEGRE